MPEPGATASGIDFAKNPALAGKTPLQVMDTVVAEAGKRGLKIILDQHRPDNIDQSALWYTPLYSEARWLSDWRMLATRYATNHTVIGADLHNEPHGAAACWGCGDPALDWAAAATRAGNAVLAADPHLLIIVEGVERQQNGVSTWWGSGLADARTDPILLASAGHLVSSPHEYPASVDPQPWFRAPNYPANLTSIWDRNLGYLATTGKTPVLLGEFGTQLLTQSDREWFTTLVGYLQRTGISYAYWSYNPDSGGTGGLVADDWRTPQTYKLNVLQPILKPVWPTSTPVKTPPASRLPVTARWQLKSSWQSAPASYGYTAQLVITAPIRQSSWSVSWHDPSVRAVPDTWGLSCHLL